MAWDTGSLRTLWKGAEGRQSCPAFLCAAAAVLMERLPGGRCSGGSVAAHHSWWNLKTGASFASSAGSCLGGRSWKARSLHTLYRGTLCASKAMVRRSGDPWGWQGNVRPIQHRRDKPRHKDPTAAGAAGDEALHFGESVFDFSHTRFADHAWPPSAQVVVDPQPADLHGWRASTSAEASPCFCQDSTRRT